MIRVAMVSPLFESVPPRLYGGTERVIDNLCRGFESSEIEVVLFASGDSKVNCELVPVIDEALRLKNPPVNDPVAYNWKLLSSVARRADEFDIIHNHHDYWMLPLTAMTQTPVVTTLHGRMDLPDQSEAFASFPNSYYISISDSQREPMPQLRWLKTIHHGINVDDFKFYEKPGKYLAFLGRINVEKRPEWAIEMAYRSGVPLKIAAKIEGPASQEYFDSKIKPHVDGKFIEYVGEISESEKSDFLGNALALTFPIDWPEPFGLVVVEALACGTPVLARPCGAMPELLKDGTTGYVNSNIQLLADHVQDIPKLSRATCRAWIQERFSLQRMTEDYIDVYRHVVAQRTRSNLNRWNFLYPVERTAHGNS
jgi:glycosyltransferase involved in cell wall biosynthesis